MSLTRRRIDQVLGAFVQCLSKLTSVTTLEVKHVHTQMTTAIKNTFDRCTFPSICTVILPPHAHELLRCCPGARSVRVNDRQDECSKLIGAIRAQCKLVDEVNDFRLATGKGNNAKSEYCNHSLHHTLNSYRPRKSGTKPHQPSFECSRRGMFTLICLHPHADSFHDYTGHPPPTRFIKTTEPPLCGTHTTC